MQLLVNTLITSSIRYVKLTRLSKQHIIIKHSLESSTPGYKIFDLIKKKFVTERSYLNFKEISPGFYFVQIDKNSPLCILDIIDNKLIDLYQEVQIGPAIFRADKEFLYIKFEDKKNELEINISDEGYIPIEEIFQKNSKFALFRSKLICLVKSINGLTLKELSRMEKLEKVGKLKETNNIVNNEELESIEYYKKGKNFVFIEYNKKISNDETKEISLVPNNEFLSPNSFLVKIFLGKKERYPRGGTGLKRLRTKTYYVNYCKETVEEMPDSFGEEKGAKPIENTPFFYIKDVGFPAFSVLSDELTNRFSPVEVYNKGFVGCCFESFYDWLGIVDKEIIGNFPDKTEFFPLEVLQKEIKSFRLYYWPSYIKFNNHMGMEHNENRNFTCFFEFYEKYKYKLKKEIKKIEGKVLSAVVKANIIILIIGNRSEIEIQIWDRKGEFGFPEKLKERISLSEKLRFLGRTLNDIEILKCSKGELVIKYSLMNFNAGTYIAIFRYNNKSINKNNLPWHFFPDKDLSLFNLMRKLNRFFNRNIEYFEEIISNKKLDIINYIELLNKKLEQLQKRLINEINEIKEKYKEELYYIEQYLTENRESEARENKNIENEDNLISEPTLSSKFCKYISDKFFKDVFQKESLNLELRDETLFEPLMESKKKLIK